MVERGKRRRNVLGVIAGWKKVRVRTRTAKTCVVLSGRGGNDMIHIKR